MLEETARGCNSKGATRYALRWYLVVFVLLSLVGWGLEIAGRAGVSRVPLNYSAMFHPLGDFDDEIAYTDLTDLETRTEHLTGPGLRQPGATPFPYPPAAAFLFEGFNQPFDDASIPYLWCFGICGAVAVLFVARGMGGRQPLAWVALGATVLLGSPHIFCANRGNLELFACSLAAAGLALFLGGFGWLAAVALGLAMCVKPFPALLLLLFVWRREWAKAALAVVVCLAVSVLALHELGPSVGGAWAAVRACWGDYFVQQVLTLNIVQELKTDHSLLDAVKVVIWRWYEHGAAGGMVLDAASGAPVWARLDVWARVFEVFALVAVGWAWVRFARMPVLNQVFALVLLMMLLPFISAEYALMLLYLPAAVLLQRMSRDGWEATGSQMVLFAVVLAMLFAPLNVLGAYAGSVKALLLVGALVFVTKVKFRELRPVLNVDIQGSDIQTQVRRVSWHMGS